MGEMEVTVNGQWSDLSITYNGRELHLPGRDARQLRDSLCRLLPPEPRRITEEEARGMGGKVRWSIVGTQDPLSGRAWFDNERTRHPAGIICGFEQRVAYIVDPAPRPVTLRDRDALDRLLRLADTAGFGDTVQAVREAMRDE